MKAAWPSHDSADAPSPVDLLLEEQRKLTAVERFSRRHEEGQLPHNEKFYRDFIPLNRPRPGEQYSFEVDLDACSGCKACVTACHSLNGLDDHETWRDVGVLLGGPDRAPFQQTVTTACHHCVEPGCLEGCPVLAYDKDPETGIVRHLDDQCIGCQYCILKCPYEVPKYSKARGIVRKCDMCHQRLAVGEAPACVQSCPNGAIAIRIVSKAEVVSKAVERFALPDAPPADITLPTTRYHSTRLRPANLRGGDHLELRPQHTHWPLVFMLLLTQASVGLFALDLVLRLGWFGAMPASASRWLPLVALAPGLAGLAVSVLHLGRPLQAWRSFLGLRTSWLSREVVALGGFGGMAGVWAVAAAANYSSLILSGGTVLAGLAGVFCSVMVYVDTHRDFWRMNLTLPKFFGTAWLLGAAGLFAVAAPLQFSTPAIQGALLLLAIGVVFKAAVELRFLRDHVTAFDEVILTPLQCTARLLRGKLGVAARGQLVLLALAGFILPLFWLANPASAWLPVLIGGLCIAAELLERYLFFTAVAPPKMPGGL